LNIEHFKPFKSLIMKHFNFLFLLALAIMITPGGRLRAQAYRYNGSGANAGDAQATGPSKGFYDITEFHVGYGLQGTEQADIVGRTGITTVAGYRFNHTLAAGLGTGLAAYNGGTSIPLYAEGGCYFGEFGLAKLRPFITADAGVLFPFYGDNTGTRIFGNPSVGLRIPMFSKKDISVSVGLFTQREKDGNLNNFINVKIGMMFF
jgi:hypothetical protein